MARDNTLALVATTSPSAAVAPPPACRWLPSSQSQRLHIVFTAANFRTLTTSTLRGRLPVSIINALSDHHNVRSSYYADDGTEAGVAKHFARHGPPTVCILVKHGSIHIGGRSVTAEACRREGALVIFDCIDRLSCHSQSDLRSKREFELVDGYLTQTEHHAKWLAALGLIGAVLPHQTCNTGDWLVALGVRQRVVNVGLLAGSAANVPREEDVLALAAACCRSGAQLVIIKSPNRGEGRNDYRLEPQACPANSAPRRCDGVAEMECGGIPPERPRWQPPRSALQPLGEDPFKQAQHFNSSSLQEIDVGLLWPPTATSLGSDGRLSRPDPYLQYMHNRPPTRLHFWWSVGVPAIGFPMPAYVESTRRAGYPSGLMHLAVPAHVESALCGIRSARTRQCLRSIGLQAARNQVSQQATAFGLFNAACQIALSRAAGFGSNRSCCTSSARGRPSGPDGISDHGRVNKPAWTPAAVTNRESGQRKKTRRAHGQHAEFVARQSQRSRARHSQGGQWGRAGDGRDGHTAGDDAAHDPRFPGRLRQLRRTTHARRGSGWQLGGCGKTADDDAGDCEAGSFGSWRIPQGETSSKVQAAAFCLSKCATCRRCRYVSASHYHADCSWYASCDLSALEHDVCWVWSAAADTLARDILNASVPAPPHHPNCKYEVLAEGAEKLAAQHVSALGHTSVPSPRGWTEQTRGAMISKDQSARRDAAARALRWVYAQKLDRAPHNAMWPKEGCGHCQPGFEALLAAGTARNCSAQGSCQRHACRLIDECVIEDTCLLGYAAAAYACAEATEVAVSPATQLQLLAFSWAALSGAQVLGRPEEGLLTLGHVISAFQARLGAYSDDEGAQRTMHWEQTLPVSTAHKLRGCPLVAGADAQLSRRLEPLYPHGRNLVFAEGGPWKSFAPYRLLPSLWAPGRPRPRRVVLVDVGPNDFYASSKWLIDMYSQVLPLTDLYLFEPSARRGRPKFKVPPHLVQGIRVTVSHAFVEVGTRRAGHDLLSWLPGVVSVEDYVVLKFDADKSNRGSTLEWGFLADLLTSPALSLVDELFIELHFRIPAELTTDCDSPDAQAGTRCLDMNWDVREHSMWQAFDVMRELRRCGVAVHAWP